MLRIDLNADAGESFGPWSLGDDAALLPNVSTVNIACGAHAGDPSVMRRTVALALEARVAIGAHPGYPDLSGFGRRSLGMAPRELEDTVLYQIGALAGIARGEGAALRHVKPHGALYHDAARDAEIADAVVRAVRAFSPDLTIVGPAGSRLATSAERAGVRYAVEAFCDRGYGPDGRLIARGSPGALIEDPSTAAAQAVSIACSGGIVVQGVRVAVRADTLCVHGDRPGAAARARAVREALTAAGVQIAALDR